MFYGHDEYESIIDYKKKEYYENLRRRVEELAIESVCPNTLSPTTPYEVTMINILTNFGMVVLGEIK